MKMHLKISSVKWRSFCPGGDELNMYDFAKIKLVCARWFPGYGITNDLQMLAKSIPEISKHLTNAARLVDLHTLQDLVRIIA